MLGKKNAVRLRRLLDVMIPILITQTAIMAMNFCDSAMSGHAGAVHCHRRQFVDAGHGIA